MDVTKNDFLAGTAFREGSKLRGAFVETGFTTDQVVAAIVEDQHLGVDESGCAFLGAPPSLGSPLANL